MNKVVWYGLLAVVLTGLVGCASDKVSSKPDADAPIIVHPIFSDPDAPIEDPGREAVITDDGVIIVDNEEWGRVSAEGLVYMKDADGEEKLVGQINKHIDGTGEYLVFYPIEGGAYFFTRDDSGKVIVNWERSIIDASWGVSPVIPDNSNFTPETRANLKARAKEARMNRTPMQFK